jgi:DnaJ family protein C protein 22
MFGVHHFYLRRTSQCFLWWSSFGGLFFIGWIRDFFRLPDYVADFNEDQEQLEKQKSSFERDDQETVSVDQEKQKSSFERDGQQTVSVDQEKRKSSFIRDGQQTVSVDQEKWKSLLKRDGQQTVSVDQGHTTKQTRKSADPKHVEKETPASDIPRISISRIIGEIGFGMFYSGLMGMAIPEGFPDFVHVMLCPVASAFGVYMVGNIGREKGDYIRSLLSAYLGEVVVWVMHFHSESQSFWISIFSTATFNWYRQRDKVRPHPSFCRRLCMLLLGMAVVWSLWGSYFYFNCEVTTDDGEKIKLRDAISHMINSPAWREFWNTMGIVWQRLREQGFYESYKKVVELADFEGEQRASEVLGVSKDASVSEIKKAHKMLVLKYHPDKTREKNSEQKFIEIQQAYETLMKVRTRKSQKSHWDEHSYSHSHDDL